MEQGVKETKINVGHFDWQDKLHQRKHSSCILSEIKAWEISRQHLFISEYGNKFKGDVADTERKGISPSHSTLTISKEDENGLTIKEYNSVSVGFSLLHYVDIDGV